MKKSTTSKVMRVVAGVLVSVTLFRTIAIFFLEKKNKSSNVQDRVIKVWDRIKSFCTTNLELKEQPTLKFCKLDGLYMAVNGSLNYSGIVLKTITSSSTDYVIQVDTEKLATMISLFQYLALFRHQNEIADLVIRHCLLHECRHLYQYQSNWWVGKTINMLLFESPVPTGYGEKEEEEDANNWALGTANTHKQRVVFKACKQVQDGINTPFIAINQTIASISLIRAFWH